MAGVNRRSRRLDWVVALALGSLVVIAVVAVLRSTGEAGPASSCEQGTWATTEVSCVAARNTSVTAPFGVAGPWTTRIWLTTLDAVDARLHPGRQVADHPIGDAVVWLFIYENGTGDRVLHVARASNAKPGAFIYIYGWPELGSPPVPATMPTIYSVVGARD
jgi:hypothetical protein